MASKVDICNMALTKLGAAPITALTDDSAEAALCNVLFDPVRDGLLRDHTWNFAVARASLARLSTTPNHEWVYEYQLPGDCLRVLSIYEKEEEGSEYVIEGRKVLTDATSVSIKYVTRETDTQKYDSTFVLLLANALAAEMAPSLAGSQSKAQAFLAIFNLTLARAKATDSIEDGSNRRIRARRWLSARL